ncbi:MAG: DUF2892 domain-containing protein [Chloroflexi bacterium]|nr:MAG: DUF2892 domain-containing protein [Chloroflexota bacterium]
MTCNVSKTDKVVRIVLSLGLLVIGVLLLGEVGILGLIIPVAIGAILTATVVLSWCPIYAIFGWSTCAADAQTNA